MKTLILSAAFLLSAWALEHDITYENSNFTLSRELAETDERILYNFNRFRVADYMTHDNWFVTAIGDVKNYLGHDYINSFEYAYFSSIESDTPFGTETSRHDYGEGEIYAQLYRLYGGYADEKQSIVFGLQKISMGVGRIWNPTDLFNPVNPLALEPDEVYGVFGLSYTYALSDLSEVMGVAAQRKDHSFKYAARLKGYLTFADVAFDFVTADDALMIGYELEGELFSTGIEVRSEGGYFEDKYLDERFFQAIFGMGYGFENSLILTGEWLHSSKTFDLQTVLTRESGLRDNLMPSHDYLGLSALYEFDMLLGGSLFGIASMDDRSFYISPVLEYSLSDDMSLSIAAMLYGGSNEGEFGAIGNTYYLYWEATF